LAALKCSPSEAIEAFEKVMSVAKDKTAVRALPFHKFAAFSAFFAFFVLFAGGMVTSTGSGLAVPDWPMSFGQMMPEMVGGVFYEHGHRMIAGIVAAFTWILMIWIHLTDERRWMRRLSLAAAFGIIIQAVLGGVTVLYGLPHQISASHAVLGQGLFCALIALAQGSSSWYAETPEAPGGTLWKRGALAVSILFVQLALGAYLRHTGAGLVPHLIGAVVAFWAVSRTAYVGQSDGGPEIWGLSVAMMLMILVQVFLGLGALVGRDTRAIGALALLPTAHQALGALILGATVLWTLRAHRVGATEKAK
jgi:cytochrome c oxidase assembly protein subunit 15